MGKTDTYTSTLDIFKKKLKRVALKTNVSQEISRGKRCFKPSDFWQITWTPL